MKKILIDISRLGNITWIGGLYYAKNITFLLSSNENIMKTNNIYIYCTKEQRAIFEDFPQKVKIINCPFKGNNKISRIYKYFFILFNRITYVYWANQLPAYINARPISWIPDFQHKALPDFFSEEEKHTRDHDFSFISFNDALPLVLSSNECLKDFRKYYGDQKKNVYVVPFVSYIDSIIKNLTKTTIDGIIKRNNLSNKPFICIMNQFWKHKNHEVVFKAMEELFTKHSSLDLTFVFTGKMYDYRNPEYIENIKKIINKPTVLPHVKMLGFISREEQIAIMKESLFVIQPSLFEGWGTVLEDAKVLDKTVLLSDIPVHKEQKNEKCILFDPYDCNALAELIYQESQKDHQDDIDKGIADMYLRAREYSKGFEQLLRDLEKKK